MKKAVKLSVSFLVAAAIFVNGLPSLACGPQYLSPVFQFEHAPERPWTDFASGKLGIVKPTHRRIVLYGAYRYLTGGSLSADEQKAIIEVWEAGFNRQDFHENDLTDAVRAWVKERKNVAEEEKPPAIYTERQYGGGYDYFPNCSKNAFEIAREILADRALRYGRESKDVQDWLKAQDQVFTNCSTGAVTPDQLTLDRSEWLRKDRDYQIAAARFYSMNYADARQRFMAIAQDNDSPWRETADYLVARTLVRQASVGGNKARQTALYAEAENYLNTSLARTPKYYEASQKLLNLIKFRLRPQERVQELALSLNLQQSGEALRQDLIDYTWLLDKFEAEAAKAEDARKRSLDSANSGNGNRPGKISKIAPSEYELREKERQEKLEQGYIEVQPYIENANVKSEYVKPDISESEIYAVFERQLDRPLTDKERTHVIEALKGEYSSSVSRNYSSGYENEYYDETSLNLAILPDFLRQDDLTDWLYTFQFQDEQSYTHSFARWQQTESELWLLTAISKAKANSTGAKFLIAAAEKANRDSVAYATIAYHLTRLYIEQGKIKEARTFLDSIINSPLDLPISTRNMFAEQRMHVADNMDDFLKYALRKPFGFGYSDEARTFADLIAERKNWWSAESYPDQTREQYDEEIERDFADKVVWQDRQFFDWDITEVMNRQFSTDMLISILQNKEFPDYWKPRLVTAIWTRAYLLKDEKTALAFAPEVMKAYPRAERAMLAYLNAPTPAQRDAAGLMAILRERYLSPYMEGSFGKENFDEFDTWSDDRWWCQQYEIEDLGDADLQRRTAFVPPFLNPAQKTKSKQEAAKLKTLGDGVDYLTKRVMAWAIRSPLDKRIPEALYIINRSNQWTKYSCGERSEEVREKTADLLKKKYLNSSWAQKLINEENEENK